MAGVRFSRTPNNPRVSNWIAFSGASATTREGKKLVDVQMTEFGRVVWSMAAKRGIRNQRALARRITEVTGEHITFHSLRNYLFGRSIAPPCLPSQLVRALGLSQTERGELAYAYTYGQDMDTAIQEAS